MSGIISGRVVDAAGAPVQDAIVAITAGPGPVSDIASRSDANGHFHRGGLAPGTYALAVHKTGHTTQNLNVQISDGQEISLEIRFDD